MKKKYLVPETHLFFCKAAAPLASSIMETVEGAEVKVPEENDDYDGNDWNSRHGGGRNIWDCEEEMDNGGW